MDAKEVQLSDKPFTK